MLNQIVIVGRLISDPIETNEENNTILNITLAVPRSYKNADGEYDTDFIDCVLWKGIATNVKEYCHKGDLIGIKGRIQTTQKDDTKITQIIAEKVTFLSSKTSEEE